MHAFIERMKKALSPKRKPQTPLNLLIEVNAFDKGGMEKVVLDMALRLNPEFFRVMIVCLGKAGHLYDVAVRQGVKVFVLDSADQHAAYEEILQNENIHLTNSHFSNFGYSLFKAHHIPNVTFIHNVYAFLPEEVKQRMIADDAYVDTYISVSQNATRYAVNRLGLSGEKFVTIPNGLILAEHEQRRQNAPVIHRKAYGLAETDYVFLNVASYNLHKGHYLMADAMQKILAKREDIKILCIGNVIYEPHITQLTQYLKEARLDGHILMPGFFPNVESFYAICDAFLLPSFIEGWSIAMNEAMFYEKPMILTNTGAAGEVIENNDIGIIVDNEYGDILNLDSPKLDYCGYEQREYQTAASLAEAMMTFADHREYWQAAGRKAQKKVCERFAFDKIVRQYETVFQRTVAQGSP